MANRRMINKRDCESLEYQSLTVRQRYLFEHVMLEADDDGILPLRYVKLKIYPFDDVSQDEITEDLSALMDAKFVDLYQTKREGYVQITNWWDRQFIAKNIHKATVHPTGNAYIPRPPNLKKYHDSRKSLEQNSKGSIGKNSSGKSSLAENRNPDDNLPFN